MTRSIGLLVLAFAFAQSAVTAQNAGWSHYGDDAGGMRYSPAEHITPDNVDQLIPAWTYRTGELKARAPQILRQMKFQATPVLHGDSFYLCTPFNIVITVDPEKWCHDPKIATFVPSTFATAANCGKAACPQRHKQHR